jgi:Asp-tRNA(Asn)/Glu-tRNA(Gln) amidotransferase A subunit family amidase
MGETALHELSAVELAGAYRAGTLSPVEVTRALLARIERLEPTLNAMYLVRPETALAAAAASEARWRAAAPLSPLDGVPITIKDNIATAGDPLPIGSAALDGLPPAPADAPPAARVREAGCVVLGKTTMPDLGMLASGVSSLHGTTRNPWDTRRNTGGSSSGAGAALAAGYAPLALGTDIGGSVRLPAAYCGVAALKPSLGRVPISPPYLGRVTGPMTRSVADAALLMNELSRPDARDFMALPPAAIDFADGLDGLDPAGLRLGLLLDIGVGTPPTAEIVAAVTAMARTLEAEGAVVTPMAPFVTPAMQDALDLFFRARSLAELAKLPAERRARLLPFVRRWAEGAEGRSAVDALAAFGEIMALRAAATAACQPFDLVLAPTSPIPAYAAEDPCPGADPARPFDHIAFTAPFNMSEQPAASVPCGFTADGLPIGLQVIGRRFDDRGVLRLARACELRRPAMRPWPIG